MKRSRNMLAKEFRNTIVYINYSPYENSGKILDFLKENFTHVFLFSIGFHQLLGKKQYNYLLIYNKGKLVSQRSLLQIPIPSKLVFEFLPLRSLIILIQVIWLCFQLYKKHGKIDVFFSVNGFTSWLGSIVKRLGLVNKTVFWVWDYYPKTHESLSIKIMRIIYSYFDMVSLKSDRVIFINKRIIELRKKTGVLSNDADFRVIPIGTEKFRGIKPKLSGSVIFGFIGVLKKSQGLDVIFDNSEKIIRQFVNSRFEIIGSGPDDSYYKMRAKNSQIKTRFWGYLSEKSFNRVLSRCTIGVATYIPDESNVSHYGDPGKVKRYLSLAIPVIVTNVFELSDEIEKSGAGVIIRYNSPKDLLEAIKKIMTNYKKFSTNALKLSHKFYYRDIYPDMFWDKN